MAAPPKPLSVDIHTSVKDGDMAKVLEFLEEGGDVNVRCRCVLLCPWIYMHAREHGHVQSSLLLHVACTCVDTCVASVFMVA